MCKTGWDGNEKPGVRSAPHSHPQTDDPFRLIHLTRGACAIHLPLAIMQLALPYVAGQFWFGLAVPILSMASLTVQLAALARGGNFLKLSSRWATIACAGTIRNMRCAMKSP